MKKWKSRICDCEILKPEHFKTKEEWLNHITEVIPGLKHWVDTQETLDYWYNFLTEELDKEWLSCET